jgi:hypothetical protein
VRETLDPSAASQPGGVVVVLANHIIAPIGILSLVVAAVDFKFHAVPSYTHVTEPEENSCPFVGLVGKSIAITHLLII